MAENQSVLHNLGLGSGGFAAGVLSAAAVGSLILGGGDVITDSAQNSSPSLIYDSGSYLTYVEDLCEGTGGQIGVVGSTATATIANPFTGSAAVLYIALDTPLNPAAVKFDIGTRTSTTASGQNIVADKTSASGAGIIEFSDASNDLIIIPPSGELNALATTDFTSAGRCKLKAWLYEYSEDLN